MKEKRNKLFIEKNSTIFCALSAIGLLITIISIQLTHGENISKIFFRDRLDTGMDFFHSIEYTRGLSPYKAWGTLYPPLANLFFYFIYHMIPRFVSDQWPDSFSESVSARGTSIDLRLSQEPLLLFVTYIVIISVLMCCILHNYLKNLKNVGIVVFFSMLSYGMLYAYERGNISIISLLCSAFFVFYKDSGNKYIRELSLVMLAVAAGLKIYPAFLGFILLYDKDYKRAARTVLYGMFFFFIPFFAFYEGIGGLPIFLNKLFAFQSSTGINLNGFSFANIMNLLATIFSRICGMELNEDMLIKFGSLSNYLISLFLLLIGFRLNKYWQKVLACCLAMQLYSSQGIYITIFLLLPLFVLFHDEENVCTIENMIITIMLSFALILLPLYDLDDFVISIKYLRFQVDLFAMFLFMLVKAIESFRKNQLSDAVIR